MSRGYVARVVALTAIGIGCAAWGIHVVATTGDVAQGCAFVALAAICLMLEPRP